MENTPVVPSSPTITRFSFEFHTIPTIVPNSQWKEDNRTPEEVKIRTRGREGLSPSNPEPLEPREAIERELRTMAVE